jgi:hypothetical protein
MSQQVVQVTVEWALRGKMAGLEGEQVLGWSTGELSKRHFDEAISRFMPGTPEQLPQVSISFVHASRKDGKQGTDYLALAIHEQAAPGDRNGIGRPGLFTRYFCVPYQEMAGAGVTYQALYESLDRIPLSFGHGRVVTSDVAMSPAPLARPDDLAPRVAALLLTGRPVCVLGADTVSVAGRLAFIDTVMSLLPYGMRTRMTAATWATATNRDHKFRLFFSGTARSNSPLDCVVNWDEPSQAAAVPEGDHAPAYHAWLTETLSQPMARLAGITKPMGFGPKAVTEALELAGVPDHEPNPFALPETAVGDLTVPLPRVSTNPTEAILLDCVAGLSTQNTARLKDYISALRIYTQQRGAVRAEDLRPYQRIIAESRLLRPGLRLHGLDDEFYDMLLTLAFGSPLDYQAYCEVEDCLSGAGSGGTGPHPALLRAIARAAQAGVGDGGSDVRVLAIVAHALGQAELTRWFAGERIDVARLIALLADKWDRPEHATIVEDVTVRYLREHPGRHSRQAVRTALQAHGYLVSALQLRYPEQDERRADMLSAFLTAAYPGGLNALIARTILTASPQSDTLFVVVLGMVGTMTDRVAVMEEFRTAQRRRLDPGDHEPS